MDRVPSHGVGVGSWPRLVASAIGGLLLTLAFPPYDVAPLAFVALIPLLWAWRDASPGWAAAYGFAFGFAFFACSMYWFAFFGVLAIVLVPAVCAAFVALTGVLVACFARRRCALALDHRRGLGGARGAPRSVAAGRLALG